MIARNLLSQRHTLQALYLLNKTPDKTNLYLICSLTLQRFYIGYNILFLIMIYEVRSKRNVCLNLIINILVGIPRGFLASETFRRLEDWRRDLWSYGSMRIVSSIPRSDSADSDSEITASNN